MRTQLVAHLKANSTLATLVSTRVYSHVLPSGHWTSAANGVVVNRLDTVPVKTAGGATNLTESLWQVDAYATTSVACDAVADAVRNCLDGYRGDIGTVAAGKVFAQRCHLQSSVDEILPPQSGQNVPQRYRTILTFEIDHDVAVPTHS